MAPRRTLVTFAPLADGLDRLAVVAREKPDQLAIVDDRPDGFVRSIDYGELNDLVNRIAHALIGSGFKPGERLLWAGRDSIEAILIQHAVRKVGGYSIALNHRLQREEVYGIARVAEATFAWAEGSFREIFAEADLPSMRQVVIFDGEPAAGQLSMEEFIAGASSEEPPPRAASERAYDPILSFTSGTTGRPKGVVRYTLGPAEARMQAELIGNGQGAFIVTGSLSHSGPNGMANNTLLLGGKVVLQRRFDAEDWMRLVDKYRVTNSYSAPYPVRHISHLPSEVVGRYDTSCFTTMIAAAAQWPFELKEAFMAAFPQCAVWELYGSTELASITVMRPEEQLSHPGSCGRLVEGVEVELIDAAGEVVTRPGEPGVLYAKGESVAVDYLGDHEAFVEASRGDFLTAGDVAYFDEEGFYFIVDRTKDMVISAGVNIYPREVENALESHVGVFESAVIGLPDAEWGERLHAVVVPARGEKPTPEDLLAHCREQLATHKVPRSFAFVDELPHLLSGKVAKREVRDRIIAELAELAG
jgi:acyl-coenzyme A synthetase/AMP-(fatty) acid ligase